MNQLLDIFPFIKQTMLELEKQNKFLNKVTLTGKINALDVAANLFEFTDKTAIIFDELKVELIDALLKENTNKIVNELEFKAKTAIDILIRNLFERTADVGFLSTDSMVKDFLNSQNVSYETIHHHLCEYASKYSVYNEIIIFDTDGNVKVNLNKSNTTVRTNDTIIQDTLNSDSYIERYLNTDIFSEQSKTLVYTQKITQNSKNIGVLCLCFKFDDEIENIFNNLSHNNEILSISNKSNILATNNKKTKNLKIKFEDSKYSIINSKYLYVSQKTSGYQGYNGIPEWYTSAMVDTSHFQELKTTETDNKSGKNLLSPELNEIIHKANNIIEDIADVIINGELIAAKQKIYLLTPILHNLRTISTELLGSIKNSIKNLEAIIEEGIVHDAKMASYLAMDIMDRNLYERANDCRWWALSALFREELSSNEVNIPSLNQSLKSINDLYTVYTNIFIFDTSQKIIACSKRKDLIGTVLDDTYIGKTLLNTDTQNYYVNDFTPTPLYDNEATYIYAATIQNHSNIVGGIGVVFDAKVEFLQILNDSFPSSKKGFMVFLDKNKKIISSNNPSLATLSTLDIDQKFINENNDGHSVYDIISFNEKEYIVASVISKGYREYKKSDNYKNIVFCLTFIAL